MNMSKSRELLNLMGNVLYKSPDGVVLSEQIKKGVKKQLISEIIYFDCLDGENWQEVFFKGTDLRVIYEDEFCIFLVKTTQSLGPGSEQEFYFHMFITYKHQLRNLTLEEIKFFADYYNLNRDRYNHSLYINFGCISKYSRKNVTNIILWIECYNKINHDVLFSFFNNSTILRVIGEMGLDIIKKEIFSLKKQDDG